jgi:hypothetical protein
MGVSMSSPVRAVRDTVRNLGWTNGLLRVIAKGLSRATKGRVRLILYELAAQPVSTGQLLPAHRGKNIRVYEAGPADPLVYWAAGRHEGVIRERFAQGGRCLVAELRGELAGFLWFKRGEYPEDEVRCLFRPEPADVCAWDYDVYVAEKHRLSPVFLRLWQAANELFSAEGVRWSCSRISGFNLASRGSHARLGARKVGWAAFLVLGKWQFMFASRTPFVHASFSERSRPVLRVRAPESD